MTIKIHVEGLSAWYGPKKAIQDIGIDFAEHEVTAIIGPSGCGKSTLIRCLNRMHETIPKARAEGKVLLDGEDIYELPAVSVRRRIGMVFQKANPFPTMSIYDNVAAGLRLNGERNRDKLDAAVLKSLFTSSCSSGPLRGLPRKSLAPSSASFTSTCRDLRKSRAKPRMVGLSSTINTVRGNVFPLASTPGSASHSQRGDRTGKLLILLRSTESG